MLDDVEAAFTKRVQAERAPSSSRWPRLCNPAA